MSISTIRELLASLYLEGVGIEIGALHMPLKVPDRAKVFYVDRMDVPSLREHYPELNQLNLVNVDIIDDGEKLLTIQDDSLDFIICNHMLEHCENPLGTIRSHMRKLKVGGVIYLAVPDKRFTFDAKREITKFEHLIADDQNGPEGSRAQHFHEWVRYPMEMDGQDPALIEQKVRELMDINYSIHYHVWDNAAFQEFLVFARVYLQQTFEVEHVQTNRSMSEIITILRRVR